MADQNPQNPLVPTPSQYLQFPQAGQLDWVALVNSTVRYPFGVLIRLQNADVNPVTVEVGTSIFSSFVFPPEGQNELNESLSRWKGYSSLSKALWFGFGVKHVVNTLLGFESGAFLVAICATLTIKYSSFEAAQILRELCNVFGAPGHMTPSIHQWSNLAAACSGSLAGSNFVHYFDTFNRHLSPRSHGNRLPAAPNKVARGLHALSSISRQPSTRAILVGGTDCAWLAAVAHCFLRLNIEIRDFRGNRSFQSQRLGQEVQSQDDVQPQIVFISDVRQVEAAASILPSQNPIFISSGEDLVQERVDFSNCQYQGPSSWSTICSDTFPEWREFSRPSVSGPFFKLLTYVSVHSQQYFAVGSSTARDSTLLPWMNWKVQGCLYHPKCTGEELFRFALSLLPELATIGAKSSLDESNIEDCSRRIRECLEQISHACACPLCRESTQHARRASSIGTLCLARIALTVIRFILILSPVNIDRFLQPSVSALRQLYNCTSQDPSTLTTIPISCHGLLLILFLLTGRLPLDHNNLQVSAASCGGACVFYQVLKDSRLPLSEAMTIEAIPGHIQHREHTYHFVRDLETASVVPDTLNNLNSPLSDFSPNKLELIVQEREEPKTLAASLLASDVHNNWSFIGIESLMEALRSSIRTSLTPNVHDHESFYLPAAGKHWSFRQTSTNAETARYETYNVTTCSMSESQWSILTWNSWKTSDSNDGIHQFLNIEFCSPNIERLYLRVAQLEKDHSHVPFWERRSRLVVLQSRKCPCWVAQSASCLWLELNALPKSKAIKFDGNKKRGTIIWHSNDSERNSQETEFEIAAIKSTHVLTKSPKRFWQFGGRGAQAQTNM